MKIISTTLLLFLALSGAAQSILKPGFDAREYAELLSLAYYSRSSPDSTTKNKAADPYKQIYRSPEMGLKNRWTLYLRQDNVASIDLRGTINNIGSWLANFYAAMIPAKGSLQINDSTRFDYQFASNPAAMVHVGWVISIAHLGPDVSRHIIEIYKERNVREFYIFGHSQGGALAFLMRSYLEFEKLNGRIPQDIIFKTYSSAGPKPGNLYYAYDYDFLTRGGWGFNVVNSADWVPETPFSIQTVDEFNKTNPFKHTRAILKKQKFFVRIAGGHIYRKLERHPRKAQRKLEKYLGALVYKKGVKNILPQLKEPDYAKGNNYMRTGTPIVLMADEEYFAKFPDSETQQFVHHHFNAYIFLLKKWYE